MPSIRRCIAADGSRRRTVFAQLSRTLPGHVSNTLRNTLTTVASNYPAIKEKLIGARKLVRRFTERIRLTGLAATGNHAIQAAARTALSRDEILLFAMPKIESSKTESPKAQSDRLDPLSWQSLAEAAIANEYDRDTLDYLTRCAQRLKQRRSTGFLLRDEQGQAVHFLWIDKYDGFYLSEIGYTLKGSSGDFVIFDCWTPQAFRGSGHYSCAIRLAAMDVQAAGGQAWIFCSTQNRPSLQGIVKAGFGYRSSLVRQRKFGYTRFTFQNAPSLPSV
jgi:hypothetical protein